MTEEPAPATPAVPESTEPSGDGGTAPAPEQTAPEPEPVAPAPVEPAPEAVPPAEQPATGEGGGVTAPPG